MYPFEQEHAGRNVRPRSLILGALFGQILSERSEECRQWLSFGEQARPLGPEGSMNGSHPRTASQSRLCCSIASVALALLFTLASTRFRSSADAASAIDL